ncbi:GNAT family N-acetyltransferase [Geobacter hydrogenophilus]|uniref:BioF2-like acetyltransferase domain-containing protein n=1 Tax=Geobacter hydrogenophilus TaxID=40983 RepID=A0A9W6G1P7_9BACT|nr:GNAT family N-acetyltransferase [Geobacter hydrogenophilus]MBT0892922.1 GNAT family N-acetyltransferase [Geobacter hydrogenophilus]GLI39245.1 hypothetical protein GHYDROH2_27460 [Geobacter hydrogenophilus]
MTRELHVKEHTIASAYSVSVTETIESFLSLKEMWDHVVRIHGTHEPFLCHDWFRIWLKYFLLDAKLFIVTLYRDSVPVLIAPFIRKNERYKRLATVRKIELIGNVHSPVKTVIFGESDSSARAESLQYLFIYLTKEFCDWDIIELDSIPEELISPDILVGSVTNAGRSIRKFNCFSDWYLNGIDYSADEYFARLPKKIRDELKRREKRISEIGAVSVEIGGDPEHFDRYMDQYDQVRVRSWKKPELDKAFLREAREMSIRNGWLRSGFLYIGDVPIAAQIRYVSNDTAYFMEALHDKQYDRYGPGNLLRLKVIEHLIDNEQTSNIDQMRGDESYKEYWTPFKRERYGVTVFNRTAMGCIFSFLLRKLLPIFRNSANTQE